MILIIIIQQLDGNVIGPRVMGQKVGLSSLGVIIAITIMGGLFGFAGMLIGVPLFALLYVGFSRLLNRRLQSQDVGERKKQEEEVPPEADVTADAASDSASREDK